MEVSDDDFLSIMHNGVTFEGCVGDRHSDSAHKRQGNQQTLKGM